MERGERKNDFDSSPRPSLPSGEGEAFRVRPDFVFPKLRLAVFVSDYFFPFGSKFAASCPGATVLSTPFFGTRALAIQRIALRTTLR